MIRAKFQNNRLFLCVPESSTKMVKFIPVTVEQMNDLKMSIDLALFERAAFLSGDWEGPKGKLD